MNYFNGKEALINLALKSGYKSKFDLISNHTLFIHPKTVEQTGNRNLFNIIRDFSKRGQIIDAEGRRLMCCDNQGPTHAFEWSLGGLKKTDIQINHIYSESKNVNLYTSLANLCATPTFLAKLTDTDEEAKRLLEYRAYYLYGFRNGYEPKKPLGYDELDWKPFFEPITDLKSYLITRLEKAPKSRTAISVRETGWLFR